VHKRQAVDEGPEEFPILNTRRIAGNDRLTAQIKPKHPKPIAVTNDAIGKFDPVSLNIQSPNSTAIKNHGVGSEFLNIR
jgi:hypothetical protein